MTRRRLQFSLRALILAVLLCGYAVGCLGRYIKSQWETRQLMRQVVEEWEQFMMADQPDHTNPYRTHGGII